MPTSYQAAEEDRVITLSPEESREAFDQEVQRLLGFDADAFLAKWKAGQLDPEDSDVSWLLALLPSILPLDECGGS